MCAARNASHYDIKPTRHVYNAKKTEPVNKKIIIHC